MTDKTEAMDLAKTLGELRAFQKACGIPHVPTQFTYELRAAISGAGPRSSEWCDKPHRLVYDACRRIEELEHMIRTGKLVVVPDDAVERMAIGISDGLATRLGRVREDWLNESTRADAAAALAALKGTDHAG